MNAKRDPRVLLGWFSPPQSARVMMELDEGEYFDIFPVFCTANIPVEVSLYAP